MKNVLMICPFARPSMGGVESHLDKLLDYLEKKRVFVYLLTYQPLSLPIKGEKLEKGDNFEIHRVLWFGQGWFNKLENIFFLSFVYLFPGLFIKSFVFFMRRPSKINCIHAHGLAAAAITKVISTIFKVRTVVSTHAIYRFPKRKILAFLIKWVLSSFDEILAVSEISKKELVGLGLDKNKIKVHKNWINLDVFVSKGRRKCKKELKFVRKTILFVGRMLEKKGVSFILSAASKFPNVDFVFIGDGPMRQEVERRADKQANIFYAGRLQQGKKEELGKLVKYYSAADLFATIPTYEEGFGAVYLEAIACGTPVLASNRGSLPTFLEDSVSKLVNPNQEEVESAIKQLFLDEPSQLVKIQKNCRIFAQKNFSDKNAEVIYKSYNFSS